MPISQRTSRALQMLLLHLVVGDIATYSSREARAECPELPGATYCADLRYIEAFLNNYVNSSGRQSPLRERTRIRWIVQQSARFNIDPRLLLAIAFAETGLNTDTGRCAGKNNPWNVLRRTNPPGCTSCSDDQGATCRCQYPCREYETLEDAVFSIASILQTGYFARNLTTPATIRPRYCTSGCEHWEGLVNTGLRLQNACPSRPGFFYPGTCLEGDCNLDGEITDEELRYIENFNHGEYPKECASTECFNGTTPYVDESGALISPNLNLAIVERNQDFPYRYPTFQTPPTLAPTLTPTGVPTATPMDTATPLPTNTLLPTAPSPATPIPTRTPSRTSVPTATIPPSCNFIVSQSFPVGDTIEANLLTRFVYQVSEPYFSRSNLAQIKIPARYVFDSNGQNIFEMSKFIDTWNSPYLRFNCPQDVSFSVEAFVLGPGPQEVYCATIKTLHCRHGAPRVNSVPWSGMFVDIVPPTPEESDE